MWFIILVLFAVVSITFYKLGKQEGRKEAVKDLDKACDIALRSIRKEEISNMRMSEVAKEVFTSFKTNFQQLIGG